MSDMVAFLWRHRRAIWLSIVLGLVARRVRRVMNPEHSRALLVGAPPDPILYPQYIFSQQGLWLHTRHWLVHKPQAHVFVCHGYGEHILRYEHVAAALNERGYSVHGIDHQGHGLSEGERAYMPELRLVAEDFVQFVGSVQCDDAPCFLLGHSMGGLLAVLVAALSMSRWKGVILSGPALQADPKVATPLKVAAARVLSHYFPKMTLEPLSADMISTVKQVVVRYKHDPLVYHGAMHTRVACEFIQNFPRAQELARSVQWPSVFVMHGKEDPICRVEASQLFFDNLNSADKEIKIYPKMLHEIFNEPGTAVSDMINWLVRRT